MTIGPRWRSIEPSSRGGTARAFFRSARSQRHPSALFGRPLDGIEYLLHLERVPKVGMEGILLGQGVEEVRQGSDESVFVPDDVTGRPKVAGIRVIRACHQDIGGALKMSGRDRVKKMQAIQILEVETQHAF